MCLYSSLVLLVNLIARQGAVCPPLLRLPPKETLSACGHKREPNGRKVAVVNGRVFFHTRSAHWPIPPRWG